jgi:hypothetical protein
MTSRRREHKYKFAVQSRTDVKGKSSYRYSLSARPFSRSSFIQSSSAAGGELEDASAAGAGAREASAAGAGVRESIDISLPLQANKQVPTVC